MEIFIFPLCIYLWSPVPKKGRICQVTLCNSYITVSLYLIFCVWHSSILNNHNRFPKDICAFFFDLQKYLYFILYSKFFFRYMPKISLKRIYFASERCCKSSDHCSCYLLLMGIRSFKKSIWCFERRVSTSHSWKNQLLQCVLSL